MNEINFFLKQNSINVIKLYIFFKYPKIFSNITDINKQI
jgi:hypothetical protein